MSGSQGLGTLLIGATRIIGYINYYEDVAKTSIDAPNSIETSGKVLNSSTELKNRLDAVSKIRKAQANADLRAREQRHRVFGQGKSKSDRDLQSEVRSKLETNLATALLAVKSSQGIVSVAGMVRTPIQLERIKL